VLAQAPDELAVVVFDNGPGGGGQLIAAAVSPSHMIPAGRLLRRLAMQLAATEHAGAAANAFREID
jgi:hypothetical protein